MTANNPTTITILTYFYFVPFFSRCAMLNMAAATASLSSSSVSLSSSSLSFLAQGVILYLCFSLNPVTPCKGPILTIFCQNRCHLSRIKSDNATLVTIPRKNVTNLYEVISVRKLEHLPRQHSHYAIKFVRRCHRHDTTETKTTSLYLCPIEQ